MKRNGFLVVVFGIFLASTILFVGCDNGTTGGSGGGIKSVPSRAQGTWYTASSGTSRIKIAVITSSQYISYMAAGYDESYNPIVSEQMRFDCTGVNGDVVEFGSGGLQVQVKKGSSSSQISIGQSGSAWTTVYK